MSPHSEEILIFVVMSILVMLFTWIYLRHPQQKTGLWMLGWACIFIHFAAPLGVEMLAFKQNLVDWIKVATLELAAACFLLSVSDKFILSRRRIAAFLIAVTLFSVCYHTALTLEVQSITVYSLLLAMSVSAWLVYAFYNFGVKSFCFYLTSALVIAYGADALVDSLRGNPDTGIFFYLSMGYGVCGIAYWRHFRKFTPGVSFTALSFIAWGLVWPIASVLGSRGPVETSFVWDLPKYFVAFGMIMTLFEAQEESATNSAREYEALFEDNLAAVYVSSPEGELLECNSAFVKMYGFASKAQARQATAQSLYVTPGDREGFLNGLQTWGVLLDYEKRMRRQDGSIFWVLERATLTIKNNRRVIQGTQVDITERKQAEIALRESEQRFATIFRQSPIGCAILTMEGVFLEVNDTLARMLRRSTSEIVGNTGLGLGLWRSQKQREDFARKLRAEGSVPGIYLEFKDAEGGEHAGLYFATVIRLGDRDCILGMQLDQTEQRKLEAKYLQSQKMESLGRLAGGIAHDFNNMLGVIGGFAELLALRSTQDAVSMRYCSRINDAAKRAGGLTRQLLTFSRREISRPAPLMPTRAITDLATILTRLIGEDVEISLDLRSSGTVIIDATHFEQIIFNIVVNARDAMPQGGELFIRVEDISRSIASASGSIEAADFVCIKIRDTGTGMDEHTRTRAFEPFYTTKGIGNGTGLGLATVYGIVQQCSGEITIESELGKGTEITILLPAAPQKEPAQMKASLPEPENGAGNILLVEDEPELREATADFLRSIGYSVQCAACGTEGLEVARQEGQIDLVISDVVMPKMNGREMAEKLREFRPDVQVMFVSGYADDVVLRAGISSHGTPFLQKPFPLKQLAVKVEELLRQKDSELTVSAS